MKHKIKYYKSVRALPEHLIDEDTMISVYPNGMITLTNPKSPEMLFDGELWIELKDKQKPMFTV